MPELEVIDAEQPADEVLRDGAGADLAAVSANCARRARRMSGAEITVGVATCGRPEASPGASPRSAARRSRRLR